jgi:hypothetical protein
VGAILISGREGPRDRAALALPTVAALKAQISRTRVSGRDSIGRMFPSAPSFRHRDPAWRNPRFCSGCADAGSHLL